MSKIFKNDYTVLSQNTTQPVVSVAMLTYNHGLYVQQALDSILSQKVDFDFEIVISDDFSTDNTRNILLDYQKKNPNRIKLVFQNSNVGASNNNYNLFQNLSGYYIAACEGDDYWTDGSKLQKQIDFLKQNVDYGLVCTNYLYDTKGVLLPNGFTSNTDTDITLLDLLYKSKVGTLTAVFENQLLNDFSWPEKSPLGDYWLWLHIVQKKKIKYWATITANYRVLENSASQRNNLEKQFLFHKEVLDITLNHIPKSNLTKQQHTAIIDQRLFPIFVNLLAQKKYKTFFIYYFKNIKLTHHINFVPLKLLINHLISK